MGQSTASYPPSQTVVLACMVCCSRARHLHALAATAEVGEEHERAPLLLDLTQEVALCAGDEAHGLGRYLDDGQVAVALVVLDGDRAHALRHDALDIPAAEEGSPIRRLMAHTKARRARS